MAATHVVSFCLPYTLAFHDKTEDDTSAPPTTARNDKRMSLELPSRPSAVSLFSGATPPLTPNASVEEFFGPPTAGSYKYFAKPGDPRSLVYSDAEVAWGAEEVFNQPRSRAAPLPSGSILDFSKVHDELETEKAQAGRRKKKIRSSPPSRGSPHPSSDRGYEGKSWTVEAAIQGNGGLTNAMRAVADSGDMSWIGTLGFPTDALPQSMKEHIEDHLRNEYASEPVYVGDKDLSGHYMNFCKTILWPIFNYQVPDHPKSKAYADHSWEFYRNVNQDFADKVVDSYKRGDIIWIHDYHLLLVPGMVRKKLPDAQIGFFLHTAFPSSEVFRCLAKRKDLLEGILGANLVAFQTNEYVQHFLQTCSRLLTVETTEEGVQLEDRFVNVHSQSIGINPPAVEEARRNEEVQDWIKTIKKRYKGKKLIVARDKLDSVHGVRQKLLAFELFLSIHEQWKDQAVLIQVATSTSADSELLLTVSDICSRVDNGRSSLIHQPLVFLKQDIDFSQYLALLTVADCLMITSLRDGMNLTAHEFILCQDGANGGKKCGPLILSEFTGSAALFHGHIPINPWDYHGMANAIRQALEMDDAEKQSRWNRLHNAVMRQTGARWAENLSQTLKKVYDEQTQRASTSIPRLSTIQLSEKYKHANRRLFFIDYEGTLAPHKSAAGISLAQPVRILDTLKELMADSKNVVYLMSGRKPEELQSIFRKTYGLGLIAENGCFIRELGAESNKWQSSFDEEHVNGWKKDVKGKLESFNERMGGEGYIEERHCSLILRYKEVEDQEAAMRHAGDCAEQVNTACREQNVQAVPITKAVLVQQTEFTKATAARYIFDTLREQAGAGGQAVPDFMMVVGDDREDEVIFRWANALGKQELVHDVFTISIGKRNTEAQAALTQGSTGLLAVLQKLAKISTDQIPLDYFNNGAQRGRTTTKSVAKM